MHSITLSLEHTQSECKRQRGGGSLFFLQEMQLDLPVVIVVVVAVVEVVVVVFSPDIERKSTR